MIELNKINKYVDINDPRRLQSKLGRPWGERINIIDDNISTIKKLDLIKNKIEFHK